MCKGDINNNFSRLFLTNIDLIISSYICKLYFYFPNHNEVDNLVYWSQPAKS